MTRWMGTAVTVAGTLLALGTITLWTPAACEAAGECKVIAEIKVSEELVDRGAPLKAKDGEHVLGRFTLPDQGAAELKTAVSRGKRTDTFLVVGGKKLPAFSGRPPREVLECLKAQGINLGGVRELFRWAMDFLVPDAEAVSCATATSFKIIRDSYGDYYLLGCDSSGRCVVCGRSPRRT